MGGAGDFVLAVRLILIPIHVQDQISFLPCGHKKELRSVGLSFWEVLGSSEILWSLFDFKSNLNESGQKQRRAVSGNKPYKVPGV